MNKRDINNLQILISQHAAGEDHLNDFLNSLGPEDLEYSLELLMNYHAQKAHFDNIINSYFE